VQGASALHTRVSARSRSRAVVAMGQACCQCPGHKEHNFPKPEPRHKTDLWCSLVFLLYLALMVFIFLYSVWNGDPRRLTHGVDYRGRVCGVDSGVEDLPYMYWCGSPERIGEFPAELLYDSTTCVENCPSGMEDTVSCLLPAYHNFSNYQGGQYQGINNVETLEVVITQSVAKQVSYPTEIYGGKFCIPAERDNNTLRQEIIDGPWADGYRWQEAFGSVRNTWPLLLLTAAISMCLGFCFLQILGHFAGLLIFVIMVLSTLLMWILGIFMICAVFMDPDNEDGAYQTANPIFRTFTGWEAKGYSIIIGMFFLVLGTCFCFITAASYSHIDEVVGLIAAATDCLRSIYQLNLFPFFMTCLFLALVVLLLFFALPWVLSLGYLDSTDISINGDQIAGLEETWKRSFWDIFMAVLFFLGCWWILEFFISLGQFVVSYAVVLWYFTEGEEVEGGNMDKMMRKAQMGQGKHVEVRVGGVDSIYGPRQGVVQQTPGGKMLVVPVAKQSGPGMNHLADMNDFKKDSPGCPVAKGFWCAFCHHLGSLALGCIIVGLCRIPRMLTQCINMFAAKKQNEDQELSGIEDDSGKGLAGACSTCALCMDFVFGKFSKNAYTEIVLTSQGFCDSARESYDFLTKTGGTFAFLHGACFLYEAFGTFFITLISAGLTLLFATQFDCFSNPTSSWYVEDPTMMTVFASIISATISLFFMMVFNHTADTLLYAFAFNRKWDREEKKHTVEDYCPMSIRYLLPAYELQPAMEDRLEPKGNRFTAFANRARRNARDAGTSRGQGESSLWNTGPYASMPPTRARP